MLGHRAGDEMSVPSLLSYMACTLYMDTFGSRTVELSWDPEHGKAFLRDNMTMEAYNDHAAMLHFLAPYKSGMHPGEALVRKLVLEQLLLPALEHKWRVFRTGKHSASIAPRFEQALRKGSHAATDLLRIIRQQTLPRSSSADFPSRSSEASGAEQPPSSLWREKRWAPDLFAAFAQDMQTAARVVGGGAEDYTSIGAGRFGHDPFLMGLSQRQRQLSYPRLFYTTLGLAVRRAFVICKKAFESSGRKKFWNLFGVKHSSGQRIHFEFELAEGLICMAELLDSDGTKLAKVRPPMMVQQ